VKERVVDSHKIIHNIKNPAESPTDRRLTYLINSGR